MTNPKKVTVIVTINSDLPGDFTVEPFPKGALPRGPKKVLEFKNDHHRGFDVHFKLVDNSGLGFKFPPADKMRSAIWSELGATSCPRDGKMEVFQPLSIEDDHMTLVAHNPNYAPVVGPFYYMLRVTRDGGSTYHELDPGGDNKNGPITRKDTAWIASALTGAIVAIGTVVLTSAALVPATLLTFAVGGAVVGLVVGLLLGQR